MSNWNWHSQTCIVVAMLLLPSLLRAGPFPFGPTGLTGHIGGHIGGKYIKVSGVAKGSPADGKIKPNDVIIGVGSSGNFKGDPRPEMAAAIDMAESRKAGGKMTLILKGNRNVILNLQVLGSYSKTAPYNCPKTSMIITRAADELLKSDVGGGATQTKLLGLLATGEKKYLEAAAQMVKNHRIPDLNDGGPVGWFWGYKCIALGEYYLLTKDETVLPALRAYALGLARGQDGLGLWGHRMARRGRAHGYGVMNQPSLSNLMGLLIAQKCGVKDPVLDKAVEKTYAWYAYLAGRGGLGYGSGGSAPSTFNNNGTSGSAAIVMSLKDNQKGAMFFSQMAATSYNSLTSGHACSFFNPLWTPLGANLSGPKVTQQFFKRSLWYYTNQRNWKGGFPGAGTAGHVAGQALLIHCLPRKALLITGREADPSIFVKDDADVAKVIKRSHINYAKASTDELLTMLNDPFIQVRLRAKDALLDRTGKGRNATAVMPEILTMIKKGNDQAKTSAISYLGGCHQDVAGKHADLLGAMLRNKGESIKVRAAVASTLAGGSFGKAAVPYCNDILRLVLEERQEPDPFQRVEYTLSKALMSIRRNFPDGKIKAEKELLYKVANRFLEHKRQNVRNAGSALVAGIPKEDFHLIAENLLHVLKNGDPTYHSYSHAIDVPAHTLLADLNVKEGLDLLVHAIYHGGGKWGFKMRALMRILPKYGGNAAPYIEKFERHHNINKKGDRFTPRWQQVVKAIRADKNPKKMTTIKEVMQAGKDAK